MPVTDPEESADASQSVPTPQESPAALVAPERSSAELSAMAQALIEARASSTEIACLEPDVPPASTEKPLTPAVDVPILNTSDMRKFLLQQMVRAAKGEIGTETVKNVVSLAQQVYNATNLELKAAVILKRAEQAIQTLDLVASDGDRK
jgi:hypothetical protein